MDYGQRAYYDMRRSQEAAMRRSNDQTRSPAQQQQQQQQQQQGQQRSSAPNQPYTYSQPYNGGGGRDSRDSRDSRGSRGSQDGGLRMSGGPEMAGVGIFFQQEPNTGKVYVANIVPGGSADRSGVIRTNDVIVKVDDEDVQGQPLSTLRNLILGRQGSYVVLAFRRMTGTELYYFDAEILRGSPEYFESLKKTQAIADEKEKLITQVRQQEQEIQHLKHTSATSMRSSGGAMPVAMAPPAAAPMATMDSMRVDLQNKVQEAKRLEDLMKQTKEDSIIKNDAENALESLRRENRRLQDTLAATGAGIAEMHKRLEEEQAQQMHERARMEKQLAEVQRSRTANAGASAQGVQQNQQLKTVMAQRHQRDIEIKRRLTETSAAMQEAMKQSEETSEMLEELVPGLDTLQKQLMVELAR